MATIGLFPSLVGAHLASNAVTGISEMAAQSGEAASYDSFMTGPQPDILLGTYARGISRLSGGGIRDMMASIEALIDDLEDQNEDVLRKSCEGLIEIGGAAVESLIRRMYGSDDVCRQICYVLGHIRDPRAVDHLISFLAHSDKDLNVAAVNALGRIGHPGAVKAVEPLIKLLQNESSDVRFSAAKALGRIGDSSAVLPLIKSLEDEEEEWFVRCLAAMSLGEIGEQQALPHLGKTFGDQDDAVQIYAERAARKIRENEGKR